MDLFIDKLAQKISSSKKNSSYNNNNTAATDRSAYAKEIAELKEKVENYEKLLQEMKLINLKNIESANKLGDMAEDMSKAYAEFKSISSEEITAADEAIEEEVMDGTRDMLQEFFEKQDDTIHKENIKVYRNVQAAVNDSLSEQTKSILDAQVAASKKSGTGFVKVMSVLIFIAVLADIALKVLPMFGIQLQF